MMKSAVSFDKVFKELSKTSCILNFYHYNASHISDAGWSSLVARRAHNPKAVGSNPAPATNNKFSKGTPFLGFFSIRNLIKLGLGSCEPNPFFMPKIFCRSF